MAGEHSLASNSFNKKALASVFSVFKAKSMPNRGLSGNEKICCFIRGIRIVREGAWGVLRKTGKLFRLEGEIFSFSL